jgi:fido (protein-threonine AMPylation protein)
LVEIPDNDPARRYTPEELEQLTSNLKDLLAAIYSGQYRERLLEPQLLHDFHSKLFRGVRSHAGRSRAPGFGSEYLVFGPHRSARHSEVGKKLVDLFRLILKRSQALRAARGQIRGNTPGDRELLIRYVVEAIESAVWAHAEVVRIHPFEDGNGRMARALMSHLLLLAGLNPIPPEFPKQEYYDCMNQYFSTGEILSLVELYLQRYSFEP